MDGFIYVAVGEQSFCAAVRSLKSLRNFHDEPVVIYTDRLYNALSFNSVELKLIKNPHRRSKVYCAKESPFNKTIYIDSDTKIVSELNGLWDLLDKYELLICHDNARVHSRNTDLDSVPVGDAFPEFNSGFFCYKKTNNMITLMHKWSEIMELGSERKDQPTLRKLLWESHVKFYVLPPEYNIRDHKYVRTWARYEATPKVLHYLRYRTWENVTFLTRIKVWIRRNLLINWKIYLKNLF